MLTNQEIKKLKETRVEMKELKVLVRKVSLYANSVTKDVNDMMRYR